MENALRLTTLAILASSLVLGACARTNKNAVESARSETPATASETPAAPPGASIEQALAHPDRLASDREIDKRRKPDQVLALFDIKPGSTVLDMFSGGGYYSEIASFIVGERGAVHAHNNTPYLKFVKDDLAKRFTPGRLPNVKRFTAENNQLDLPAETFDAVLLILSYHDVYHVAPQYGWEKLDGPKMLAEIFQSMKSGAVLGVVDHVAAAGAPPETGETLHRIDPELAKKEITAAGFVFEAESDALRNPDDPHTDSAFSKEMRGRTDRFIFRFRKP